MKYGIKILYFLFLLTILAPLSYAADSDLTASQGVSEQEINAMIEKSLQSQLSVGSVAAPMITNQTDDKAEKENKVFRYQTKKGAFSESELPQRTFNNIRYPY